jgi:arginine metabolism regulation protein II
VGTLSLQDFFDRATVLERCIIQWNTAADPHNREESSCQSLLGDTNGCVLNYYHTALHHALLIYFYRRIYNLDTTTLQKEVKETLNALLQYEPDDSGPTRYTSGIVWPGFIAASEALDPEVQDAFRSWFDRCVRRSGLKTFELSKSAVEKIWKRKREIRDTSISLNEFIKSQRIQLFYS